MSADAFLQLRSLAKDFDGHVAVDNISIDIARGEVFALLGSSGCGKTTLLRLLAGFETPSAGTILLDGRDLAGLAPYERPLNMMFQSYALFPHLSVGDNIAFGLKRDKLPTREIEARVAAMLDLVQLASFAKRKPHQLSGGQQQRVALARSLAKKPQLLLLDEPLGALDRKLREETQIELAGIIHDVGVTCVMVTHDQDEAMALATRIGVMSEGRLLQVGAPDEVYENPNSRFVADFIGNVNLMDGRVLASEGDHLLVDCGDCRHRIAAGGGTAKPGADVSVALRPEKIRIDFAAPNESATAMPNQVRGVVKELAYFGNATVYRLELPGGRVLKVSRSNIDRGAHRHIERGQTAWASWSSQAPLVLDR